MASDYQTAMTNRLCNLISEYESVMGSEAIIQAVSYALELTAIRLDCAGVYTRAAKYEAASVVLRRK